MEGVNAVLLLSCGIVCARIVEALSSWICGAESERWSEILHTGYVDILHRMKSLLSVEAENCVGAELVSWCRTR